MYTYMILVIMMKNIIMINKSFALAPQGHRDLPARLRSLRSLPQLLELYIPLYIYIYIYIHMSLSLSLYIYIYIYLYTGQGIHADEA